MARLSHITQIITDQDAALQWYQDVLGCEVRRDDPMEFEGMTMRWLTVAFPGTDVEIVLTPPMPGPDGRPPPKAGDGNMTVLSVADCNAFVSDAKAMGANVVTEPEAMPWGISAIIRDPDGNPYNIVQPIEAAVQAA